MSQPFYIYVESNGRGYAYRLKHRIGNVTTMSFDPVKFYTVDKAVQDASDEAKLLGCKVELSADVEDALKANKG